MLDEGMKKAIVRWLYAFITLVRTKHLRKRRHDR
jgi:hypothetical protein